MDFKVRTIVGTVILVVNSLPPHAIAQLTCLDPKGSRCTLSQFSRYFRWAKIRTNPSSHSTSHFRTTSPTPPAATQGFLVSSGCLHTKLTMNCLSMMNEELEQDLLFLPEYALNSESTTIQSSPSSTSPTNDHNHHYVSHTTSPFNRNFQSTWGRFAFRATS